MCMGCLLLYILAFADILKIYVELDMIIKQLIREAGRVIERLTETYPCDSCNVEVCYRRCYKITLWAEKAKEKLAEYENTEEEGRLVVLPCKVGDKVYQIISRYTECTPFGDTFDESSCCGCEEECDSHQTYEIVETKVYTLEDIAWNIRCGNWGKNIFTDREEAEKALERMRQSNATN